MPKTAPRITLMMAKMITASMAIPGPPSQLVPSKMCSWGIHFETLGIETKDSS